MTTKRDYYEILGVSRTSDADEIKRAYRRLAREYHPDVSKEDGADEKFKELNEAYTVLSDENKRSAYDRFGHAGVDLSGVAAEGDFFGGIGDIFDAFFGGGGRSGRSATEAGRDLRVDLEVPLIEALTGGKREVTFDRMETCVDCGGSGAKPGTQPTVCGVCRGAGQVRHMRQTLLGSITQIVPCEKCRGMGTVIADPCQGCKGRKRVTRSHVHVLEIPPGVEDGSMRRIQHEGDAGVDGGKPGDLYVVYHVNPEKKFERQGTELFTRKNITFVKAALGGKTNVAGLDAEYELEIPAGTQPGAEFRVAEAGMPPVGGGPRGHLHVEIGIKVPKKLNENQRSLLRQFAVAGGEDLEAVADTGERTFWENFKDRIKGETD